MLSARPLITANSDGSVGCRANARFDPPRGRRDLCDRTDEFGCRARDRAPSAPVSLLKTTRMGVTFGRISRLALTSKRRVAATTSIRCSILRAVKGRVVVTEDEITALPAER